MEQVRTTLQRLQETISSLDLNRSSNKCWRCFDTGTRYVDTDGVKRAYSCLCVRRKTARAQIAIIPPKYGKPKLSRLKPRVDLHPIQARAVAAVKANPMGSYLLLGNNGKGKSHLAWALYRYAISARRPTVTCIVSDLLKDYQRVEVGVHGDSTLKSPRVTSEDLTRASRPWFLFIDEFEKARPSEFAAEMLFKMLDAADSFKHQLVIASNFREDQLRNHWGRIDPVWGNSIMTRLQGCTVVKFF